MLKTREAASGDSRRARTRRRALAAGPSRAVFPGYETELGRYQVAKIESWLSSSQARHSAGKVNLILTSPPFPLNHKKSYGNLTGAEYIEWLESLAPRFAEMLADDGSLVIEIGNAWNPGAPTMSTLPIEALLAIKQAGHLHLCQEFICHNPARLPSPAQHVTVDRIRLKDSWTRVWWLSRSERPKADNREILLPYSKAMRDLLRRQKYNHGQRPSQHVISESGFLKDNGGAIPASCVTTEVLDHFGSLIVAGNTGSADPYLTWCRKNHVMAHPARMQPALARFFISFLTNKGDLVLDPFAGSNTTGRMAEESGRRWISIEAEITNLASSKSRFLAVTRR